MVPDACTLPTDEQPLRVAQLDDLFRDHVVGVDGPEEPGGTAVVLHQRGAEGLPASIRDLTDREAWCCSFFTFTYLDEAGPTAEVVDGAGGASADSAERSP